MKDDKSPKIVLVSQPSRANDMNLFFEWSWEEVVRTDLREIEHVEGV